MIFIRSANIVPCYLIFLSIWSRREARRVHVENLTDFLQFWIAPYAVRTFLYYFDDLSAIQPEFILDYWNKSGDFWDSLPSIVPIVSVVWERFHMIAS